MEKKKSRVNLILSIISFSITTLLLVLISFAWYAVNKTAYVSAGIGRTKGDDYTLKLQRGIYSSGTWDWVYTNDLAITNLQPGDSYFFRFEIDYDKKVKFETSFSEISSSLVENSLEVWTVDSTKYIRLYGIEQNWLSTTTNVVSITEVINGVNQTPKQLYSISNDDIVSLNTQDYNVADTFYLYDYGLGTTTFTQDGIIDDNDTKEGSETRISKAILTSNPNIRFDLSNLVENSGTAFGYFALEFSDSLSTKTYIHIDSTTSSDSNLYQCQTLKIGSIALRDITEG